MLPAAVLAVALLAAIVLAAAFPVAGVFMWVWVVGCVIAWRRKKWGM